MLPCPTNLTHSLIIVCKIITFKVDGKVFPLCPRETTEYWRPKKPFFWVYGMSLFEFLFIGRLGTCP
jgi:hypothetical protein